MVHPRDNKTKYCMPFVITNDFLKAWWSLQDVIRIRHEPANTEFQSYKLNVYQIVKFFNSILHLSSNTYACLWRSDLTKYASNAVPQPRSMNIQNNTYWYILFSWFVHHATQIDIPPMFVWYLLIWVRTTSQKEKTVHILGPFLRDLQ